MECTSIILFLRVTEELHIWSQKEGVSGQNIGSFHASFHNVSIYIRQVTTTASNVMEINFFPCLLLGDKTNNMYFFGRNYSCVSEHLVLS